MTMLWDLPDNGTGTVFCPSRGQRLSVETCRDCQWLLHTTSRGGMATVRCAPPPPLHLRPADQTPELARR